MRRWIATLLLAIAPAGLKAQTVPVVLSGGPDQVSVTLYRDPERGDRQIDRDDPSSFALISEVRTITLPPGRVTVRFEGVASGIVPQSAILFGTDPRERNRDAALLSHAGLVDAYTGQQVTLRRTDPATGKTVEERATIRSAANRMIIHTSRGAEAVYCSGLAQTLLYPGAPPTLSAKPVLTMTTRDQSGGKVTITLAYIATGFDWDATYVGTLGEGDAKLNLFAWLTMASADDTSFVDATTSAVAGRINRSDETRDDDARRAIAAARWLDKTSQCWPAGTTSDVRAPAPPPPPPAPMMMDMAGEEIVVTARRREEKLQAIPIAVTAQSESLSDLKLYRIPVPVTVAARSQKQVAFLANRHLSGALVYRSRASCCEPGEPELLYRFKNVKRDGLGEPLPAGNVVLYQDGPRGRQLVGEARLNDKAVGEDVEIVFGDAQGVSLEYDDERIEGGSKYVVTVRNANSFPVRYELEFINDPDTSIHGFSGKLVTKAGKRVWATTLPPNSETRVSYKTKEHEGT
jgi:hypothetical protein